MNKLLISLLFLIACSVASFAQGNLGTGGKTYAPGTLTPVLRANLPSPGDVNRIWSVTDCADATCATGGGSTKVAMKWNGSAYAAVSGGGGGSDITIGTTAITSGTANRVLFEGAGNVVSEDADLTFLTDTLTFTKGVASTNLTIGAGSAITSSGAGGALGTNAFNSTAYLPLAGGTLTGNLLFTDNTLDIGASGATRPRTGYFGTSVVAPSFIGSGSGAGFLQLGQGSAPSLGTTAIQFVAPASVTSYQFILPGAAATGIPHFANSANVVTETISAINLAGADVTGTLPVGNGGTGVTSLGTGVATALGVNVGSAGAFVVNGGALGSPSSAGTLPAFTLGGTIAGGGNQLNNIVIGTSTPLAGTFTVGVFGSTTSLLLGTAGSAVGNIGFRNATSGTATLAPPTGALSTYTVTLPNAASTLPIFGQQITFTGPTAARSIALPDAAFTVARTDAGQTFTGTQAFGAITASGVITQTSASATAFESGPNGGTNPVFRLVNNTASAATGLSITGAAAGGRVALNVLSSGTNEDLVVNLKGTGTAYFIGGSTSLPSIAVGSIGNGYGWGYQGGLMSYSGGSTGQDFIAPDMYSNPSGSIAWSSSGVAGSSAADIALNRVSAGVVGIHTAVGGGTSGALKANAIIGGGTTPTISSGTIGTGSRNIAGFFTSTTTGTYTGTLTFNGITAPVGWSCGVSNQTTANLIRQTGGSTTTAVFSGTTVSGDVISYTCAAY